MRALSLATVIIVFAVAACSDVAAPIAAGPDAPSLMKIGRGAPTFHGGRGFDNGRKDYDHDQQTCADDDDAQAKDDHHYSPSFDRHDYGHHDYGWGRRGHRHSRRGRRGHDHHHRGKHGHDDGDKDEEDCGGASDSTGGSGGSGGDTIATISGTVMGNGAGLNSFPVFLLNGTTVVANTATTADGTGSYAFVGVQPGTYLVCEDNPFTDAHGFLGETQPSAGPSCPSGYAPRGFSVTVGAGEAVGGSDFKNFTLE